MIELQPIFTIVGIVTIVGAILYVLAKIVVRTYNMFYNLYHRPINNYDDIVALIENVGETKAVILWNKKKLASHVVDEHPVEIVTIVLKINELIKEMRTAYDFEVELLT